MTKNLSNIIIGSFVSAIYVGLFIFIFETNRSFLEAIVGFLLFLFPFSFLSSFKSKLGSFILVSFLIIFIYISYKLGYKDIWIGIIQAFLIGGSMYIFKVKKVKVFSKEDFINKTKKKRE